MAANPAPKGSAYRRVLLKLSGEALQSRDRSASVDAAALRGVAERVRTVRGYGVEVGIVVGGGNIFRGVAGMAAGIGRGSGDYMGMLATILNGLALRDAFDAAGVDARVMSGLWVQKAVDPFDPWEARRHLDAGRVVVFVGGTGNPFFSTDTAAALRACEIGADALLKATKVDGVYTADPVRNPSARRYETLTYREALEKSLGVMDAAAFSLCMENNVPIVVFDFFKPGSLEGVVRGEKIGTVVGA